MNEKSFINNIDDETLAKMIDMTLNYKKAAKNRKFPTAVVIKFVSAAAAVALFIGLLNILPVLINLDNNNINPAGEITRDENIYAPEINRGDLFLPEIVEKSFFENSILAAITDEITAYKFNAFYSLKDPSNPDLSDREREDMLITYPICKHFSIYALDPDTSKKERETLLGFMLEYTDITRDDMMQMCINIEYDPTEYIAALHRYLYDTVRFGETEDTLLLDIEWYPYGAYLDEEGKVYYDEILDPLKEYKYISKLINGEQRKIAFILDESDMEERLDSNGYYIFNIYTQPLFVCYTDENNTIKYENFAAVSSQQEYDILAEEQIKPFCDDLLAQGFITEEYYDEITTRNILDYYINIFFN